MHEATAEAMRRFIERLLLRSELTEVEVEALLSLPSRSLTVQTNRYFVRPGEVTEHACLIVEGLAARTEHLSDGLRQITALHLPGEMADLYSVVVPKTSWALVALAPTIIAQIPHASLRALSEQYPAIARAFWRDCAVDACVLAQWAVSLGRRWASGRAAHLLCELACRYDRSATPPVHQFRLGMAQAHVADVLGLTAIHVNRTFRELRERGLISVAGGKASIADWAGLVSLADFDPAYLHFHDEKAT